MTRPVHRSATPRPTAGPIAKAPALRVVAPVASIALGALLTLAVVPTATAKGDKDESPPRSVGVIEGKVYSTPDRRQAPIARW